MGRVPTLLVASSSAALNGAFAVAGYAYAQSLASEALLSSDLDLSDSQAVAQLFACTALRWCSLNYGIALAGMGGVAFSHTKLVRVFAIGSVLDVGAAAFLLFSAFLVTVSPSLAALAADLICDELTRGSFFGSSTLLTERQGRWGLRGADAVLWGAEVCEENYRPAMLLLLLAATLGLGLRICGIWVTWEYLGSLVRRDAAAAGSEDWFDLRGEKYYDDPHPRPRSSSVSSLRTTSRLSNQPSNFGRFKSHSVPTSQRPRLVLVPVFSDGSLDSTYTSPISPSSTPYSPRRHRKSSSSSHSSNRTPSPTSSVISTASSLARRSRAGSSPVRSPKSPSSSSSRSKGFPSPSTPSTNTYFQPEADSSRAREESAAKEERADKWV